ncbi:hypothetical protein Glove_13g91 [Diversispora epigaea]|uniref:BACK domain-containing protein n=1 Tax=Diversispora epigaea TaxID=1348612 RepID=A0A397JW93_9GLOM|nr:hypothetical protein Glove_13g91 [Diversispora epigaea]
MLAANRFELKELTNKLEILLIDTKTSWLKTYFSLIYRTIFNENNFKNLENYCNDIIVKHPNIIFDSSDFTSLPESALVSLLKRGDLQMEEAKIWDYIIKWGISQNPTLPTSLEEWSKENFLTLKTTIQQCLPLIRYFHISSTEIFDKIRPYKKLLDKQLWLDINQHLVAPDRPVKSNILPARSTFVKEHAAHTYLTTNVPYQFGAQMYQAGGQLNVYPSPPAQQNYYLTKDRQASTSPQNMGFHGGKGYIPSPYGPYSSANTGYTGYTAQSPPNLAPQQQLPSSNLPNQAATMVRQQQQPSQLVRAPTPTPVNKHSLGDRTHIPTQHKPIFDILNNEFVKVQQDSQPSQKKILDDIERRLNVLFDALNNEDISPEVIKSLTDLVRALEARNYYTANIFLVLLMTTKMAECSTWIVGIKHLISILKTYQYIY